ncbi:MAG: hypothetical protein ACE14U_07070, partial [Candidatus Velamenicoccus archaeovorus]
MSQYAVQRDAPAYPIKAGCSFLRHAEAYPFWVNSALTRSAETADQENLRRMAVLAGCAQADGLPWRKFSSAQVRSQRLFLNFACSEKSLRSKKQK